MGCAVEALDGTQGQVRPYPSISFTAAEYFPEFAYPGGNSGMLRHVVKWLIPSAISGSTDAELLANPFNLAALDSANNTVRIRQGASLLRGATSSHTPSAVYF